MGEDALRSSVESKNLESLSLEELLDIEITSVSKKEQRLSESAAEIFTNPSEVQRSFYGRIIVQF